MYGHTGLELLAEILHTFSNGFKWQGSPNPLQCILQLGKCFRFWLHRAAYGKLPALPPKHDHLTHSGQANLGPFVLVNDVAASICKFAPRHCHSLSLAPVNPG